MDSTQENQWWDPVPSSGSSAAYPDELTSGYFTLPYNTPAPSDNGAPFLYSPAGQPSGDYACFVPVPASPALVDPGPGAGGSGGEVEGGLYAPPWFDPPEHDGDSPSRVPADGPGSTPSTESLPGSRTGSGVGTPPWLRTSKGPGRQLTGANSVTSPEKRSAAREGHNHVEKKYRDRLNEEFGLLLATLKSHPGADDNNDEDDDGGPPRPASKSTVLRLARRQLLEVGRRNQQLSAEVERLTDLLRHGQ